jgi:hypothetical protein
MTVISIVYTLCNRSFFIAFVTWFYTVACPHKSRYLFDHTLHLTNSKPCRMWISPPLLNDLWSVPNQLLCWLLQMLLVGSASRMPINNHLAHKVVLNITNIEHILIIKLLLQEVRTGAARKRTPTTKTPKTCYTASLMCCIMLRIFNND